MAITISIDTKDDIEEDKLATQVSEWLSHCEKTLEFIFQNEAPELSVMEALQGPPQVKICDTIGDLDDPYLKKKLASVEDLDTGKEVKEEDRMKTRSMLVKLTNGDEASGRWVRGKREGQASVMGARLEKAGVKFMSGQYEDGILSGLGKVIMMDSTVRQGWFRHGYLHGPVRGFHMNYFRGSFDNTTISWLGHYKAGIPTGTCWSSVMGGGWMVGQVDSYGSFTGSNIAFIYPDLISALVGEWKEGTLISGKRARLTQLSTVGGVLVPGFTVTDSNEYQQWISTSERLLCPPHLQDPYESRTVKVGQSNVEDGGEGLYARRNLTGGSLVAFYNGVRMVKGQPSPYKDTGYAIFLEWVERGKKSGEHMDLPPEFHSSENYTATLGHKLNHSFVPNCEWSNAVHPCYGLVPSVVAMMDIKEGEELTVNYAMGMDSAPEWYQKCWDDHSRSNS